MLAVAQAAGKGIEVRTSLTPRRCGGQPQSISFLAEQIVRKVHVGILVLYVQILVPISGGPAGIIVLNIGEITREQLRIIVTAFGRQHGGQRSRWSGTF